MDEDLGARVARLEEELLTVQAMKSCLVQMASLLAEQFPQGFLSLLERLDTLARDIRAGRAEGRTPADAQVHEFAARMLEVGAGWAVDNPAR